jgi:hypothetical protein
MCYIWSVVLTLFFFLYFYSTFSNIQNHYEVFSPSINCLCLLIPYRYKVLYDLKLIDIYEFKRFQTNYWDPNRPL